MPRMGIGLAFVGALVACGGRVEAVAIPPPPAIDAGGTDAARLVDASVGEAGAVAIDAAASDAAFDAPPLGPWCGANFPYGVTFCDDFDPSFSPRPEWVATGSGLAVVDSTFVSAPHALHVLAAPGTVSQLAFATKNVAIESKADAQVEVVADGASATSGDPVVVAITCEGGQSFGVAIVPGTSNAHCFDSGFSPSETYADFSFARGAWHDVELKLSVNQDGTYNPFCLVDGVLHGRNQPASVSAPAGNMTLVVGVAATTTQAVEAYYDDVVDDVMQ